MSSITHQTLLALGFADSSVALAAMPKPQAFSDSFSCREAVSRLPEHVAIVVINRAAHAAITPINLAATLCQDNLRRDVYLWEEQPSGSLVSRARAAGIRGVINRSQLGQLLDASQIHDEDTSVDQNTASQTTPQPAILELETLELDEPINKHLIFKPEANDQLTNGISEPAKPDTTLIKNPIPTFDPYTGERLDSQPQPLDTQPQPLDTSVAGVFPDYSSIFNSTSSLSIDSVSQSSLANIIGVFSGRGGVGKSTVALLLAILAHQRGIKVALIDADLQFGDIAYLLGHEKQLNPDIRSLMTMHQTSTDFSTSGQLLVLTAPETVEQSELIGDSMSETVQQVATYYDLVLINTSAYWTAAQAQLARACTRLLFLMDQRTTSLKACQRVLDLCIKLQIPEARFHFAINGCHRFAPISPQDASLALGQSVVGLDDGGTLVDELLSLGCPWELIDSGNVFVRSLERLLNQLAPQNSGRSGNGQMPGQYGESQKASGLGLFKNLFSKGFRDVA
ncbi:MAG: P-loop NTPase [Coriobacteriales bacterium]|jgi:pilus assembly protein CpaE|nr:P-loop NTPase [Coriobacteriales bacterium]